MQLYIGQKRYNSTSNIKQSEWNHNDSHLFLMNNKEEYNHCSDVKSSFGWVISYTSLAKVVGMGNKPLSLWVTRISLLRFGLVGAKKPLPALNS